jgi:hypothetical protein
MEAFIILFVFGLFIYLNLPEKKPPKKDPWEELGKAIGTAMKSLNAPSDGGSGSGGKKGNDMPWFISIALLTGLVAYLLHG